MKLEELVPQSSHENGTALDDVSIGEELYDVWKLYEAGDYDIALTNGQSILERCPDSASAHSLMALIYERKADAMISAGETQSARDFLKQALEHYETIIDLNPDSAGDRQKIASLRVKLNGVAVTEPKKPVPVGFRAAIKAVPTPILATMGTFLVVLALGIIFMDFGRSDEPDRAKPNTTKPPRLDVPSSLNASNGSATVTPSDPASASTTLEVYRFPEASSNTNGSRQTPAPPLPNPVPERSREIPEIEPEKLPGITMPLETKPKKPTATVQEVKPAKVDLPRTETAIKPEPTPAPKPDNGTATAGASSDKQAPKATGSSLLAQAIQSSQHGDYEEAIRLAQQAVSIYQSDIDSDRNVDAANRGIKNARNLIKVWQSAGSN